MKPSTLVLRLCPLVLAAPLALVASLPGSAAPPVQDTSDAVVVAWSRTAVRTAYTENAMPPPVGGFYLAFSSLAVHDAVQDALRHGNASPQAAAAAAAHAVLVEYFVDHPVVATNAATAGNLAADLATSLGAVPDGPPEAKGIQIGRRSAAQVIASRVGDGRHDASVVYTKAPALGIWQAPPAGMQAAWVGHVRPVVLQKFLPVGSPDALDSAAYAADFNEVKVVGSKLDTDTTRDQTARFFSANPVAAFRSALANHLGANPGHIGETARMYAELDASLADAFRHAWRLKLDVGFWRPSEAITRTCEVPSLPCDDGNPATTGDPAWLPRLNNPAYSDYVSGHSMATSTFAQTVRRHLGNVTLVIPSSVTMTTRSLTMDELEEQAFLARIWSGIHFRKAMTDGYSLGHRTADEVHRKLG